MERQKKEVAKPSSLSSKMASCVLANMEDAFYRLGFVIGTHPWPVLCSSLLLCLVCGSGLVFWNENTDNEIIWTPYSSPFVATTRWMQRHFPKDMRYETIIVSSDQNVLTADHIYFLRKLNETIHELTAAFEGHAISYVDLCFLDLEAESTQSKSCYVESILDLWPESESNLSDESVQATITSALTSDKSSKVRRLIAGADPKSVRALMSVWVLRSNGTKEEGKAESDPVAEAWETSFIEAINNHSLINHLGIPENTAISCLADKSFMEEIEGAVASNYYRLFVGCSLIFVYIALVLGRRHPVQQRVLLALSGPVLIVFAILSSFGLCSLLGLFAANMHPVIPFLLLAIGVDDIFVIVQSLENLPVDVRGAPLGHRMGETLRHAGVSVSVTSATDAVAFLIGSTTDMPVLRSFCLYAAAGVLFLYIFAMTYFTACLTLDERRIDAGRVLRRQFRPDWRPNFDPDDLPLHKLFSKYLVPKLFRPKMKMLVLFVTAVSLVVGVVGVAHLETNCDTKWYVSSSSYVASFFADLEKFFPQQGQRVHVYIGDIDYWRHLDELQQLHSGLESNVYIQSDSVVNWFPIFYNEYCKVDEEIDRIDDKKGNLSEILFSFNNDDFFTDFDSKEMRLNGSINEVGNPCEDELKFKQSFLLFLNEHRSFYPDFRFSLDLRNASRERLWAGQFEILASRASFRHVRLLNTSVENLALNSVQRQLSRIRFESEQFATPVALAKEYMQWESNKLVSGELVRNLGLAFVAIIVVTLVLVVHLRVTLLVLMSVVLTLVDVAGFVYFLGLTVEIVTSILLILSCGLALDYAVHVGVAFVALRNRPGLSRAERAERALSEMGLAVCHGGVTTFISFALLASSDSYVFTTFFQVFALVVVFGLWHGVFFLPVALSLVGSDHSGATELNAKGDMDEEDVLDKRSSIIKSKSHDRNDANDINEIVMLNDMVSNQP